MEQNQHDSGTLLSGYGHLGYINWFLRNDHLPDFDVRTVDQFWHPPLHYMLAAAFLKVCWRLFPALSGNYELIQALPLLYITLASVLAADILRLVIRKDSTAFFLGLAFTVFSPAMVICSASVNSDALLMMFACLTLDLSIRWFRDPKLWLILCLAASFGLSMSAKKSGCLLAFPIGLLFAVRFFGAGQTGTILPRRKLLGQFVLFLAVASPLALWWYVRNYALYGVPMGYVWSIDDPASYEAYLGRLTAWQRLSDLNPRHFSYRNVFMQYTNDSLQDTNPFIGLFKTAAFDTWTWTFSDGRFKKLSWLLLLIRTAIVLLTTGAGLFYMLRSVFSSRYDNDPEIPSRTVSCALLLFTLLEAASYYAFCFSFPFVWTMNYRYIEAILPVQSVLIMETCRHTKTGRRILLFLIPVFCLSVILFFIAAGRAYS